MVRVRLLLFLVVLVGANPALVSRASAAQWSADRQFVLVEPPPPLGLYPPPSSVVEDRDGSLLVLVYWPVIKQSQGLISEFPRTRLVRIAIDGSRAFVPPFGQLEPGSRDTRINVDDEILPLPDGSLLFTVYNAIDRLRPDGSIVRFAGTGRYSEQSSGDGGPATAADIGFPHGLARFPDGSIVFADRSRIRRVAPNGIITTIAGTGGTGFGGDGGPATAARLSGPSDVLPMPHGGYLIADTYNGRVRRVSPDGVISTIAGTDKADIFDSFGDGGPAIAAGLALPAHLARLPDGSLLIGEAKRIRRVAPDATISTIFDLPEIHGNRVGDFAGRYSDGIEAMNVTREGGIAVILSGFHLRAVYLAPRRTRRTLVALRDARASQRRVKVTVDTTTPGRVRLQVRRKGKLIAHATRHLRAGRHVIGVRGRFATANHEVRVTLRADRGGGYSDRISLFTSSTLPKRLVPGAGKPGRIGEIVVRACKRIDGRRIDCEVHDLEEEGDSGRTCLNTTAYRLFPSGLLFNRPYGRPCHDKPMPFDRTPKWTDLWRALFPQ
jgi:hypothetical protein